MPKRKCSDNKPVFDNKKAEVHCANCHRRMRFYYNILTMAGRWIHEGEDA